MTKTESQDIDRKDHFRNFIQNDINEKSFYFHIKNLCIEVSFDLDNELT